MSNTSYIMFLNQKRTLGIFFNVKLSYITAESLSYLYIIGKILEKTERNEIDNIKNFVFTKVWINSQRTLCMIYSNNTIVVYDICFIRTSPMYSPPKHWAFISSSSCMAHSDTSPSSSFTHRPASPALSLILKPYIN